MNEDMMSGTEQGQTELKLGVDSMDIVDKKKSSLTGQPMYRTLLYSASLKRGGAFFVFS